MRRWILLAFAMGVGCYAPNRGGNEGWGRARGDRCATEAACVGAADGPTVPAELEIPEACRPSVAALEAVERVHATAEESVHELVTCGAMQTSIARSLVVMVLAS